MTPTSGNRSAPSGASRGENLNIQTISVPMGDTGIGKAAGYRDDEHLREAAAAERAALDPKVRAIVDEIGERFERAILFGSETPPQPPGEGAESEGSK